MFFVPVSRDSRLRAHLFDNAIAGVFGAAATPETAPLRSPVLDVAETETAYTVKLEVPGVAKDDIKISVDGRRVSLQAHSALGDGQKDGERLVYRERPTTRYARTFTLPLEVDQAESGAKLEHGVLTLTLPKRHLRAAAQITVN